MPDTQPASDPYEPGDRVRIRIADADAESPHEGTVCRVAHVFFGERSANDPTPKSESDPERETADAAYRLEDVETGDTLSIVVRHADLVPASDSE